MRTYKVRGEPGLIQTRAALLSALERVWIILFRGINKYFVKVTACATALCFLAASFGPRTVSAVMAEAQEASRIESLFSGIGIPASLGRITDVSDAGTKEVVVNIQDLHCHGEVQRKIEKILSLLDKRYGLREVWQEGAYGELDTSWLGKIRDKRIKGRVVEYLVEKGELTGGEYYSVKSGKTKIIKGLEEERLYRKNLERLGEVIESQKKIKGILSKLDYNIEELKEKYYNGNQKKLGSLITRYRSGLMDGRRYYGEIKRYASKYGIDIRSYGEISDYIKILEIERKLKYKAIAFEAREYVREIRDRLSYRVYEELGEKTDNFRDADKLYGYLMKIEDEYGLAEGRKTREEGRGTKEEGRKYKELESFFEYMRINGRINPVRLLREEEGLCAALRSQLGEKESERKAAFEADFFTYVKDYYTNKISAGDYEYYKEKEGKFRGIWEEYIRNEKLDMLKPYEDLYREFYEANIKRNESFIGNVFGDGGTKGEGRKGSGRGKIEERSKDNGRGAREEGRDADEDRIGMGERVLGRVKDGRELKVLVTGGFHTEGLKELLKKRGITYVVITPAVTEGTGVSSEIYERLAREEGRFLREEIALLAASEGPEKLKAKEVLESLLSEAHRNGGIPCEELNKALQEQTNNKYGFRVIGYDERGAPNRFDIFDYKKGEVAWRGEVDGDNGKVELREGPGKGKKGEGRAYGAKSRYAMAGVTAASFGAIWGAVVSKAVVFGALTAGFWTFTIGVLGIGGYIAWKYIKQGKGIEDGARRVREIYQGNYEGIEEQKAQEEIDETGKDEIISEYLMFKGEKVGLKYDPSLNGSKTLFRYNEADDKIHVNYPLMSSMDDIKRLRVGIRHDMGHKRIREYFKSHKRINKIYGRLPEIIKEIIEEFINSLGDALDYFPIALRERQKAREREIKAILVDIPKVENQKNMSLVEFAKYAFASSFSIRFSQKQFQKIDAAINEMRADIEKAREKVINELHNNYANVDVDEINTQLQLYNDQKKILVNVKSLLENIKKPNGPIEFKGKPGGLLKRLLSETSSDISFQLVKGVHEIIESDRILRMKKFEKNIENIKITKPGVGDFTKIIPLIVLFAGGLLFPMPDIVNMFCQLFANIPGIIILFSIVSALTLFQYRKKEPPALISARKELNTELVNPENAYIGPAKGLEALIEKNNKQEILKNTSRVKIIENFNPGTPENPSFDLAGIHISFRRRASVLCYN